VSDFWEKRYKGGHRQRYPWDSVVSFIFRSVPHDRKREDVSILEVGFGTGANLWFAAREGFRVSGIEAVPAAIETAKNRFADEGLTGDLRQGSFTDLPFPDESFDLIIDRASLACSPLSEIQDAINEITRVAKPGCRFFFNTYADSHSSARSGRDAGGRVREDISEGSLAGLDRIAFLTASDVIDLLEPAWRIESMKRLELIEMISAVRDIHSEWRVIAEKQET